MKKQTKLSLCEMKVSCKILGAMTELRWWWAPLMHFSTKRPAQLGSWRAPADCQGCGFPGHCCSRWDQWVIETRIPLATGETSCSVENKVLGNERVMSGNVPVDKLFCSCPLDFLELPAVYYLWLSKACCWTRWSGPVGCIYSSYGHHVGKKPLRKRKASG